GLAGNRAVRLPDGGARRALVPEVAAAGEDHRPAGAPHRFGHPGIAPRAARLDDRRDAGLERRLRAVGERKERVRREHRAGYVMAVLSRLVEGELDGVDAARLTAPEPDRREVFRDDDRIGADVFAHAPCEDEVAPRLLAREAAGDLHALAVVDVPVAVLHE